MEALVSLGVDGMFTNFPARLEQVLESMLRTARRLRRKLPGPRGLSSRPLADRRWQFPYRGFREETPIFFVQGPTRIDRY